MTPKSVNDESKISQYAPNPHPIPDPHQPCGFCPLWRGQGEVEAQGEPPHPGACAAVGGAPGWGSGLLARYDALPAQDQARPFQGPCAAVDRPLGGRIGIAGKAGVSADCRGTLPP